MILFIICQGLGGFKSRVILFAERGVIISQSPVVFFASVFLLKLPFTRKKINSTANNLSLIPPSPPQVNHYCTYYPKYEGHKGKEVDQDKYLGGVLCKGKGRRYGGEYKRGKK